MKHNFAFQPGARTKAEPHELLHIAPSVVKSRLQQSVYLARACEFVRAG